MLYYVLNLVFMDMIFPKNNFIDSQIIVKDEKLNTKKLVNKKNNS